MALWTHHWPRSQPCWDLPAPCNGTDQGWKVYGCSCGVVRSLCALSLATLLHGQSWQYPHNPQPELPGQTLLWDYTGNITLRKDQVDPSKLQL